MTASNYAIFDSATWQRNAIRRQFAAVGLKLLHEPNELINRTLQTLPEHLAFFVVREFPHGSGLAGFQWMQQQVTAIRKICPTAGIVFISNSASFRQQAVPPLVWVVKEGQIDIEELLEEVTFLKLEQCPQYRDRKFFKTDSYLSEVQTASAMASSPEGIAPNYNIKHPSMLVPLAMASAKSNREIYCEISPQEALTFFNVTYSRDTRKMVMEGLSSLRGAIDKVNKEFQSSLKLHLDHCDDLELIEHAAAIGFDSIMADGSARGLAQNIAFTKRASRIVDRFGIPLEGEVGHIDGGGPRRWNKTRVEDFLTFINETEIDYVGVHIGQFHSFSYDYERSRNNYASIVGARGRAGGEDWNAFVRACGTLDQTLEEQGFLRNSIERQLIAKCALLALDGGPSRISSVIALLDAVSSTAAFFQQSFLAELEEAWLELRLERIGRQRTLWDEMFPAEAPKQMMQKARIDFGLLEELSDLLVQRKSSLVIHGGSSILEDDLPLLANHKVARVNFGTEVFNEYLAFLAAELPQGSGLQLSSHLGKMAFLAEAAGTWEKWMCVSPPAIDSFSQRIIAKHLSVMHKMGAVSMPSVVEEASIEP